MAGEAPGCMGSRMAERSRQHVWSFSSSHTAVEASTIDCISWGLEYWSYGWRNDTLNRFWWVRDGGGRPPKLGEKRIHSLLHDAPYSAAVRAG